ncbi:MAG: acyl-CoA thioesterase [Pseudomonadota bacterium]
MNLFFRLLVMLARNLLFPRRIGYLDESILNFRVWITDHDAFMHMNNSRYTSICDLGSIDLLMKAGVFGPVRKAGFSPVIVYRGVTLHRMLRFPNAYSIRTCIIGWDGPYVCFKHDFVRKTKLCAEAISIGRMVGKGDNKPDIERILTALDLPEPPKSPPLPDVCRNKIDEVETARAKRAADRKKALIKNKKNLL